MLVWMGLMFVMSTSVGSNTVSEHILAKLLKQIIPAITPEMLEGLNAVARKMAHVTEYAILAVLLYRALHQGYQRKMIQAFRNSAVIAVLFAALDEFHQSFVASRTPSVTDVMIDAAGAGIGIIVLLMIHRRSHQPNASW